MLQKTHMGGRWTPLPPSFLMLQEVMHKKHKGGITNTLLLHVAANVVKKGAGGGGFVPPFFPLFYKVL